MSQNGMTLCIRTSGEEHRFDYRIVEIDSGIWEDRFPPKPHRHGLEKPPLSELKELVSKYGSIHLLNNNEDDDTVDNFIDKLYEDNSIEYGTVCLEYPTERW